VRLIRKKNIMSTRRTATLVWCIEYKSTSANTRTKREQCFSGHLLVYRTTSFFKKQWKSILSWAEHKWKKKRSENENNIKSPCETAKGYEGKITTIPSQLDNHRWIEGVVSWNDIPMTDIQIVVFQKSLWKLVFFFSTHKNVHNSKVTVVMYILHKYILYIIWLFYGNIPRVVI